MKQKIFYILGIFIILMIMFTMPIYATTATVNTDNLNLRAEASTTASIIEVLSANTQVEVLSENGDWYQVKHGENTGYVSKQYISVTDTSENSANNTTNTSEVNTVSQTGKVNRDTQIKILPSINSNKIGELKSETEIKIISYTNNWAFIETDNITGWIPLISLNNTTEDNQETTTPNETTPTEESNTTNTETNTTTTTETQTNTDNNTTTSGTDYEKSVTKYVNTTSVYVRSSNSTSSDIVATLIQNTDVIVTGEDGDWYKVKYNDITGYIRKDLLSDTTTQTTSRSGDIIDRTETTTEDTSASTDTSSSVSSEGSQIVEYAKQYLGCPYVYGASGPSNFDCSGFTMYVYKHFGYSLPHGATSQSSYGTAVNKSDLQPGDLVFFLDYETMDGIGHCGIYIGDGNFIHASSGSGNCVKISTLTSGSYLTRYYCARRLI